jgi:hypothetical protein
MSSDQMIVSYISYYLDITMPYGRFYGIFFWCQNLTTGHQTATCFAQINTLLTSIIIITLGFLNVH